MKDYHEARKYLGEPDRCNHHNRRLQFAAIETVNIKICDVEDSTPIQEEEKIQMKPVSLL
jgi:hypothetical protein